ncbi:DUF4386 family protein [Nocardiopsis aegyptia]|uniref:DUF4386 family protein n=1 Tax=Nocardiopsis aegyptia TaxID=220378 RepID=A0A7Z0EHN2_9ACTN|nr:DUF4386 family protein [Nocardiopsis aegyptia]NYJ32219.1 hypothetical protein [Nocardiopsis aegyptia]
MNTTRWAGLGLLVLVLVLFVGTAFGDPGIDAETAESVDQDVRNAHDSTPWIVVAQAVQVATAPLAVLAGVGLYLPLRRTSPGLAMVGLLMLVLGGLITALQGMTGMSMVMTSTLYTGGNLVPAGSEYLLGVVLALTAVHWATWLSGWAVLGLAVAAFGYGLSWRTRVLPRWSGWLALVVGALLLVAPLVAALWVFFFAWALGALLLLVWMVAASVVLLVRAPRVESEFTEAGASPGR